MLDGVIPAQLAAAFDDYERALMADDTVTLDRRFAPGGQTMRGDADGLLVGHDAISRFRAARGGAPPRRIVVAHARALGDAHAVIVAVTENRASGRGLQTQVWERAGDEWVIAAAHVMPPPAALDTRVWRVVGDPLVAPASPGPLSGETVAVKDLFAVAGFARGAGNPAWLAGAPREAAHAHAVEALGRAGAAVRGIARTDELAFSLSGINAHSGTPPNPRAPGRIPGGSTSGPASAVALGHATVGLGTDTAGSIRVPAAYQGLFGIRTTHGAVDRAGLLPLAPSFDTVGWLTRDADLLGRVGDVLLPPDTARPGPLGSVAELTALADDDVSAVVGAFATRAGAVEASWDGAAELAAWLAAFQTVQRHEAWAAHGDWLVDHLDTLGDDVRARFELARDTTAEQAATAQATVTAARARVGELLAERTLVVPAAASVAPTPADAATVRGRTLRLTCLASIAGAVAVAVPLVTAAGLPCAACLVGPPGSDHALLALAGELAERR
ncbi:MAG: DUF3225 domain-containing protein [Ilumatobacteraceae bacterium]